MQIFLLLHKIFSEDNYFWMREIECVQQERVQMRIVSEIEFSCFDLFLFQQVAKNNKKRMQFSRYKLEHNSQFSQK
jgi:hypothetical protein